MLVHIGHLAHRLHQQHKAFQRGAQAVKKDRLEQIVQRAAAHRMATGLHIARGGNKDHGTVKTLQQRVVDQRDALPVRQIVVEQHQPRLMLLDQLARLLQRGRDARHAQMEMLLDKLAVQIGEMRLIFHNHYFERLSVVHEKFLSKRRTGTG